MFVARMRTNCPLKDWRSFPVILCLAISSCGESSSGNASQSLDNEEMRVVLLNLHLAQADLERGPDWRAEVFAEHQADSMQFHETLRYYAANPDSAQGVYDWVQDQLAEKREQILAREREILKED